MRINPVFEETFKAIHGSQDREACLPFISLASQILVHHSTTLSLACCDFYLSVSETASDDILASAFQAILKHIQSEVTSFLDINNPEKDRFKVVLRGLLDSVKTESDQVLYLMAQCCACLARFGDS